jgi:hypothetical protein
MLGLLLQVGNLPSQQINEVAALLWSPKLLILGNQ